MITCHLSHVTNAGKEKQKRVIVESLKFRDRSIEHILKYSTIVFDDKTELWVLGNEDEGAAEFVEYINNIKDMNIHLYITIDTTRMAWDEDIVDISVYVDSELIKGYTASFLESNLPYVF